MDPVSSMFTRWLLVRVSLMDPKGFTRWVLLMIQITAHIAEKRYEVYGAARSYNES